MADAILQTMDLTAFPGGDLVQEGLADLARGVESIPALRRPGPGSPQGTPSR